MADIVSVPSRRPRVEYPPVSESATRPTDPAAAPGGLDLREFFNVLKRRRGVIIGCAALLTAAATLIIFQLTPRYTAEAIVMLDTRKTQVVDIQAVMSGLQSDAAVVRSEVEVLKSPALAEKVAQKLNLTQEKEFNPQLRTSPWKMFDPRAWIPQDWLLMVGIGKTPDDLQELDPQQKLLDSVVGAVSKKLTIVNDGRSYILKVRFESESPTLSAKIANTFADLYLVEQLEAKYAATRRANAWLNERLGGLKDKVRDSERAVQLYKEKNKLTESKGITVTAQQLGEINSQLIVASGDRAQKEAALRQVQEMIKSGHIDSSSQVLSSQLIQRLREQETELLRKEAEFSQRYKPAHPTMVNLRAEIKDLRQKISVEANKIVQGLAGEVNAARAREGALKSNLQDLQQSTAQLDKSQVQLRELEREAESNRTLYENFLTRFKQTSAQEDIQQADARLVAEAKVPTVASFPKKLLFVQLALALSAIVGVILAFVIERLDNGFRASEQIEKLAGMATLGLVPNVRDSKPHDVVVQKPVSSYSEAIRSIRTALAFSDVDDPPKIVVVTSSVPAEGKTMFATSLARSVACSGGRALLVDCDLRRPAVAKTLGLKTKTPGFVALFADGVPLQDLVQVDEESGLHYIPTSEGTSNPQDLLGSQQMRKFLETARQHYDLVVLDAPPVLAVSDALVLSHMADSTIFLVRWERTPRPVVLGALKVLRTQGAELAGVVLSRVNVKKHAKYGYGDHGYYYGQYGSYYGKS